MLLSVAFVYFLVRKMLYICCISLCNLNHELVSRKMVIKELKDRFLVRRKMEVGNLGKTYSLLNLAYVGVKTRQRRIRHLFRTNAKRPSLRLGLSLNLMPGSSLLSHGEPHTTIGATAFHF